MSTFLDLGGGDGGWGGEWMLILALLWQALFSLTYTFIAVLFKKIIIMLCKILIQKTSYVQTWFDCYICSNNSKLFLSRFKKIIKCCSVGLWSLLASSDLHGHTTFYDLDQFSRSWENLKKYPKVTLLCFECYFCCWSLLYESVEGSLFLCLMIGFSYS